MATWIACQVKKLYRVNGTTCVNVGPARLDSPPKNGQRIKFEIGTEQVIARISEDPVELNPEVYEVVAREIME